MYTQIIFEKNGSNLSSISFLRFVWKIYLSPPPYYHTSEGQNDSNGGGRFSQHANDDNVINTSMFLASKQNADIIRGYRKKLTLEKNEGEMRFATWNDGDMKSGEPGFRMSKGWWKYRVELNLGSVSFLLFYIFIIPRPIFTLIFYSPWFPLCARPFSLAPWVELRIILDKMKKLWRSKRNECKGAGFCSFPATLNCYAVNARLQGILCQPTRRQTK